MELSSVAGDNFKIRHEDISHNIQSMLVKPWQYLTFKTSFIAILANIHKSIKAVLKTKNKKLCDSDTLFIWLMFF